MPTSDRGVTLTELMIAVAILSIAVLGLIATFGGIQRGIQMGKDKTLASNLAQEKMQKLKQQTYFRVLPTLSPSYLPPPDNSPYDTTVFPPETILQGGVTFQRYTYVKVVTVTGGVLDMSLPNTTPDTGMRLITIMVTWPERGQIKKITLNSVMANPNTVEADCVFTGTVKNAAPPNNPIPGALVNIAENVGWRSIADAGGNYNIQLYPGNFHIWASMPGFFSQMSYQSIGPNNTVTVNFLLTSMSSGSVVGTAWVNPNIVISQVVVSTPQANGYDVEYIELFNPTLNAVSVSGGGINLNFVSGHNTTQCLNVPLTYVNTTILSNKYYVIANTTTFMVNGATITADAYYTDTANASCSPGAYSWSVPAARDIMHRGHSGTWWLTDSSGNTLDAVGWSLNGAIYSPSHCLGTCYYTTAGLQAGWELVRASSPTFFSANYGRTYKSGDNSIDFTTSTTLQYSPFSSAAPAQTVIAGVPAVGAVVSATDGLSSISTAVSAGNPPVASFALTQVATGTWSIFITSNAFQLRNDTVTIAAMGSVYTFPSSTTILNQSATLGFISGIVTDVTDTPISVPSAIQVTPVGAGAAAYANIVNGGYLLAVSTAHPVNVTANLNFLNPNYVSVSSNGISVGLGQVKSNVNFALAQGGRLTGWVTRDGINGLQGETVTVSDANGNKQDQEVTDVNGRFTTINLATGTYTARIPLDTTESSSPTVANATTVLGQTVFAATFTITGALGTITGNVTLSGNPIPTGVLIVVTTGTLLGAPPSLSSSSLTGISYYAASSREDSTYTISVRQNTAPAYNVYGYYSTVDPSGNVTITPRSLANVSVTAGQTTSGENLAW